MKRSFKTLLSFCCLFLIALACTKDVGLITEVEFELLEVHTQDGFVNQGLPTTFTIVPEEILENYEYNISYEILQGTGYFEDVEGNIWETGTGKGLPVSSPLTTSLLYMGTEVGEHRLKIVGEDNFGISEEIEILYNLTNVPARWEANSALTEIELGKDAELSVLFEIINTSLDVSYEARFEFASGSGTLAPSEEGGYTLGGEYATIAPGTYPFVFTPSELGPQQLVFILRDSNGQEIRSALAFNVVENIRVISIILEGDDTITMQLGDEIPPDVTFDPPNATDQEITVVSSDPDVVFIDENNVCIAVGLGTAVITVTSTANPEASDTVTVTVVEPDRVPVTSIVISQEDPAANGAVRQLIATVLPEDATDSSVTWASSDTAIATIGTNGLLTGLAAGTVTITATSISDPEVGDGITVEITGGSLQNGLDITAFELPGQNGSDLDPATHTITVNVTDGTELNVAPSALSISGGATIAPGIADIQDFNTPVTYTVTAGDGTAQEWTVNVTVSPAVGDGENDITAFGLPGQTNAAIDDTAYTITVTVADGMVLNVAPEVLVISDSATIVPAIDAVQDFSGPVEYRVTAQNGDAQVWTVNTTVLPATGSDANDITAFTLQGQNSSSIDETTHTITVNVPDGTLLADIAPSELTVSPGATFDPLLSATQDFNLAVEYTVTAANGDIQVWTINTTVAANRPPVAVDDTTGLEVGQTITIDVLDNDSDIDTPNSELTITTIGAVSPAGFGNATISGNQIQFISNGPLGEPEIVSFDYTINDGNPGNDATGTVTVNISLNEVLVTGITLVPTELALNVDQTGQLSAAVVPANPTNGALDWTSNDESVATVSATGEVTAIGVGTAVITASSNDASNVEAAATITVTLAGSAENAITAFALPGQNSSNINVGNHTISVNVTEGTELNVAPESFTISAGASITPAVDVIQDFNEQVTYTVTAENDSTQEWTVSVTVSPPAGSAENAITAFELPGQNSAVIDPDEYTVAVNVPDGTDLNVAPTTLSISPNATVDPPIGTIQDFSGLVQYTVTAENNSPQLWSITTIVAANLPPVAVDDETGVGSGENVTIDVLANDTDVDTPNSELRIIGVIGVQPDNAGSFTENGREFVFTSTEGYVGDATFGYTVNDGNTGNDDFGQVTVTITQIEVLVSGITIEPDAMDILVDETANLDAIVVPADATNRTMIWASSNTDVVTVDQTGHIIGIAPGNATITGTSSDGTNITGEAFIAVDYLDIPVDEVTIDPSSGSIKVGETLGLTAETLPQDATTPGVDWSSSNENFATVNANGLVTGVGEGTVDIIATAIDGNGAFQSASITVTAANTTPTAEDFSVTVEENSTDNSIDLAPHINDADGDVLTVSINSGPSNGSATVSGTTIIYTPTADYNGGDSIGFTVTDYTGANATDTITITVNAGNNDPVANDDAFTVTENGNFSGSVFDNNGNGPDFDEDGDNFTVVQIISNSSSGVGEPARGSDGGLFTIEANGNLTFSTNGDFDALNDGQTVQTSVGYRINDANGGTATATVTVTVTGVSPTNNLPTANDDTYEVAENASSGTIGYVMENDTDLDPTDDLIVDRVNNSASFVGVVVVGGGSPPGGFLTISDNGTLVFDPNGDFDDLKLGDSRTVTATYRITDGNNAFSVATVNINVNGVEDPNAAPTVNAGNNFSITLPTSTANLSGSATDGDGSIATYQWSQQSGPGSAVIASPNTAATGLSGLVEGTYVFRLTATDNDNASGSDTVSITVNEATNNAPTVNAGNNVSITLPTSTANLSGSASDGDGSIASYQWSQQSGPGSAVIASPNTAATGLSGLVEGTYVFRLTATDDDNATGSDTVSVTVNEATNNAPTVNAGNNVSITLPTSTANLSGSATDGDGSIASYQWSQQSGPGSAVIASPNLVATGLSGLVEGTYVFRLTATDDDNATGSDTVSVTVNEAENQSPIAVNDNYSVSGISGTILNVRENDSDPDGNPIRILDFTQPSEGSIQMAPGPSLAILYTPPNPQSPTDVLTEFTYRITDENLNSQPATVNLIVGAPANTPPNAVASASITSGFAPLKVDFMGSLSNDPGGSIVSYRWEFQDTGGPSTAINPSHTFNTPGTYNVTLTVTDNGSPALTDTSTPITITVNDPPPAILTWDVGTGTLSGPVGTSVTITLSLSSHPGNATLSTIDNDVVVCYLCGNQYPQTDSFTINIPSSGRVNVSGSHFSSVVTGSATVTFSSGVGTQTQTMSNNGF